jgi:hypothetical protein
MCGDLPAYLADKAPQPVHRPRALLEQVEAFPIAQDRRPAPLEHLVDPADRRGWIALALAHGDPAEGPDASSAAVSTGHSGRAKSARSRSGMRLSTTTE